MKIVTEASTRSPYIRKTEGKGRGAGGIENFTERSLAFTDPRQNHKQQHGKHKIGDYRVWKHGEDRASTNSPRLIMEVISVVMVFAENLAARCRS